MEMSGSWPALSVSPARVLPILQPFLHGCNVRPPYLYGQASHAARFMWNGDILHVGVLMLLWRRALVLGAFSWLIPFILGFAMFPLKQHSASLFETVVVLVLVVTAGMLLSHYFEGRPVTLPEALLVGLLWLAMNLLLDYPMFAYGPMKMSAAQYYSEIGVAYLAFPAFAFGAARLAAVARPV